jgi:hypothetical protein
MPRWVEGVIPPGKRALRHIDPTLQGLGVGDVIADWGGRDVTFEIVTLDVRLARRRPLVVGVGAVTDPWSDRALTAVPRGAR